MTGDASSLLHRQYAGRLCRGVMQKCRPRPPESIMNALDVGYSLGRNRITTGECEEWWTGRI